MNRPLHASRANDATPESAHRLGLRLIASYKMLQALGLLAAAGAAFHLKRQYNLDRLLGWLAHLSLSESDGIRQQLIELLSTMGPHRFVLIGAVALGYAALFAIEGIGLWMRRHWAEWFTVIATGSLIPVELYEVVQHASALKFAVLLANVAIVIYLARIAMQPHHRH
ncbi:DUF2127 domain-containing protein [Dyella sp.]|uniref:DUF2127 domain-containing protein n=1 Tax=Dyella sp. TaxID=1869338 RepID=UPI002D77F85B|nr:DUF2127 domain-containing protein [Dyella sp.]HET6433300.1 DUF2127 domain-containing protein [Dyella sp.]